MAEPAVTVWRVLLLVAAAFNWAVGASILTAPAFVMRTLGGEAPEELAIYRAAGVLAIYMGCVFALAAREPARFRSLIWMAAFGKLAVVAIYAQAWLSGEVALGQLGVALGDLVFAVLFVAVLLTGPRLARDARPPDLFGI
jgi:hypothetical protein